MVVRSGGQQGLGRLQILLHHHAGLHRFSACWTAQQAAARMGAHGGTRFARDCRWRKRVGAVEHCSSDQGRRQHLSRSSACEELLQQAVAASPGRRAHGHVRLASSQPSSTIVAFIKGRRQQAGGSGVQGLAGGLLRQGAPETGFGFSFVAGARPAQRCGRPRRSAVPLLRCMCCPSPFSRARRRSPCLHAFRDDRAHCTCVKPAQDSAAEQERGGSSKMGERSLQR